MRTILGLVMALGLAVVGCGNNECEDAVDKADECDLDLGNQKPSDDAVSECNSTDECRAKCVNGASCEELKTGSTSLLSCITACGS